VADASLPADTALVRLNSCDEYLHADAAMRDLASPEAEHPAEEDLQVVLLTADSLEFFRSRLVLPLRVGESAKPSRAYLNHVASVERPP
jgi:hypothetical protein